MFLLRGMDGGDGNLDGAYVAGGEVVDADAEDVFARCGKIDLLP